MCLSENAGFGGSIDRTDFGFVEREATPRPLMNLSVQLHLAGLSLSNTILILDRFGVERSRSTVHNWGHKADRQPRDGRNPDHVAVDETVIQLDGQQYWLSAAVDLDSNELLHLTLSSTRNQAAAELFLAELTEKHDVGDAVFLVDGTLWLHAALHRHGLRFQHETHGNRNAIERVSREGKRRTSSFSDSFRHVHAETVAEWVNAVAVTWISVSEHYRRYVFDSTDTASIASECRFRP